MELEQTNYQELYRRTIFWSDCNVGTEYENIFYSRVIIFVSSLFFSNILYAFEPRFI